MIEVMSWGSIGDFYYKKISFVKLLIVLNFEQLFAILGYAFN
jgi:hypothetical protein